jgi:hypothetical protein
MNTAKQVGYADAVGNSRVRKMGPKEIRSVETEIGEKGGHTTMHRFKNSGDGPYHESEGPHIFGASEGHKLVEHLIEHLGIKGVKVSAAKEDD